ncbi:hypothetical protein D3C71_2131870 [compost metagenome]
MLREFIIRQETAHSFHTRLQIRHFSFKLTDLIPELCRTFKFLMFDFRLQFPSKLFNLPFALNLSAGAFWNFPAMNDAAMHAF